MAKTEILKQTITPENEEKQDLVLKGNSPKLRVEIRL